MVRHTSENERLGTNVKGGEGTLKFYDICTEEELLGHGTMYAKVVMPPHTSLGFHIHTGNTEPYFVIQGKGIFENPDHTKVEVHPGDACIIKVGEGHSIANPFDEDLVFIALIYNE